MSKIDWYSLKTDLKEDVWNGLEMVINDTDSELSGWNDEEDRPHRWTEKKLKKLTKTELIEQVLDIEEKFNERLTDAIGEGRDEASLAVDSMRQSILSLDKDVLIVVKRSLRYMEGNEQ